MCLGIAAVCAPLRADTIIEYPYELISSFVGGRIWLPFSSFRWTLITQAEDFILTSPTLNPPGQIVQCTDSVFGPCNVIDFFVSVPNQTFGLSDRKSQHRCF